MTEEDQVAYLRNLLGEYTDYMMELFRKAYPEHQIIDLAFMDAGRRHAAVASRFGARKEGL